ncbi:hypothetical protein AVEN_186462-1 [Araneus ventricosus]|uniref:Uncharacterized protein n=1 Tax=Araneus ventricosus TaxID=182803 RepID=A0A4Y2S3M9_ARAVE|nr:hypothetical protein AVEN_186462-1 [Araneus ventricosus]
MLSKQRILQGLLLEGTTGPSITPNLSSSGTVYWNQAFTARAAPREEVSGKNIKEAMDSPAVRGHRQVIMCRSRFRS